MSSFCEALRASTSPSPSTSTANTDTAPSALLEIVFSVKLLLPLLRYRAILSSFSEALRTSTSPSPSTSAANNDKARSALVEIIISFAPTTLDVGLVLSVIVRVAVLSPGVELTSYCSGAPVGSSVRVKVTVSPPSVTTSSLGTILMSTLVCPSGITTLPFFPSKVTVGRVFSTVRTP